jgi:hypothetical protein
MKTRAELYSLITTDINTNSNGEITAAKVRNILDETVDSYVHKDDKDATGGVPGLTLFKINFRNVANTFTSFFTNSNTAARTYTFQDRNGTIADDTDLDLKVSYTGATTDLVMPLSTNIRLLNVTPSQILYIDSSNNILSLSASTYPSLTELSYGKGVTSAVQTQLDSKLNIEPNVQTVVSSATVTAVSTNDLVNITAQAAGLTLANPTGTFYNGQIISFRIKDNATPQSIAYGAKFKAFGSALPTTTVASKITLLSAMYNSVDDTFETVNSQEQ